MKKHIINPKNILIIAAELAYNTSNLDIKQLLSDIGINITDFNTKATDAELIANVFMHYSTSSKKAEHKLIFKIIEEILNYLSREIESKKFQKLEDILRTILFHDKLFLYKNKVYESEGGTDELSPENMFLHFLIEEQKKSLSSLELYLKKKISTEADWIDDLPYEPFMLSFNNNTLTQIVSVIEDLDNRGLVHISGNTGDDFRTKDFDINWNLIKTIDSSPEKIDSMQLSIDTEVFKDWTDEDEDGNEIQTFPKEELEEEINEEITKFIYEERKATKEAVEIWKRFGSCDDTNEAKYIKQHEGKSDFGIAHNFYSYRKQKEIVIAHIINLYEKYGTEQVVLYFSSIEDPEIDVLRTICALEFEGLIDMLQLSNDKVEWVDKDNIFVRLVTDIKKIKEALSRPEQKLEIADPEKTAKVSLKDITIRFNLDNGNLTLGSKIIPLGTDTDQYYVCKFMFDEKIELHKSYPWDEIYELMTGDDNPDPKRWKKVNNAMTAVVDKVKRALNTENKLFDYKNKGVRRNY